MENTETLILENIKFEGQLLGKCFFSKDCLIKVLEYLTEEDFSEYFHKLVFKVIKRLVSNNIDVDLLSVYKEIETSEFDKRDSNIYQLLFSLTEMAELFYNDEQHILLLKEYSNNRKLFATSQKIIDLLNSGKKATDIKKELELDLFSINTDILLKDTDSFNKICDDFINDFQDMNNNLDQGLTIKPSYIKSTGYSKLDESLGGGASDSNLIIVGGRPAMGKSTFLLNIAWNMAKQNKKVRFYSLEMSKQEVFRKILAYEINLNPYFFKNGAISKDIRTKIFNKVQEISRLYFFLSDASELTPNQLRNDIKKTELEHGKLDSVFIDYLQLMDIDVTNKFESNRVQEISKITRELKKQAKFFNLPIWAAAQLSRYLEKRSDKRPQLSDLRESGSIEQDANIIFFVYRDDYYNKNSDKKSIAELIKAKHRDGELNTIDYFFDGALSRFRELEN